MIISRIVAGTGNQLFQYAAARRLAHKLNTKLKLDITHYKDGRGYRLNLFNVNADLATPEEIAEFKNSGRIKQEQNIFTAEFMTQALDYPDNIYLQGFWEEERYFADIADIIKSEFTLKNPLSPTAETWKQKILSSECSVSIHVRRGNFLRTGINMFAVLPLDYYYECLNRLRQQHNTPPQRYLFSRMT